MFKYKGLRHSFTLIFIVVNFILFDTKLSVAQNTLSLEEAIQIGLNNNFSLKINGLETSINKNNNSWANAGRYPSINFSINNNNRHQQIDNPASFLNGGVSNIGVNTQTEVSWTLFDGYKVRINKSRLKLLEQQSLGNEEIIVQNLIQAIMLSYFKTYLESEKLKVFEDAYKLSKEKYDYVIEKREFGSLSSYDLLQSESALISDEENLLMQKSILKNQMIELNTILQNPANLQYQLTDSLVIINPLPELDSLKNKLISNNVDIQNEYLNYELLKNNFQSERSDYSPTFRLNLGNSNSISTITVGDNPTRTGKNYDFYINFSLAFNLYNGGRVKREIQNAQLNTNIGKLKIGQMKLELSNELSKSYESFSLYLSLLKLEEKNINIANQLYQESYSRFKNGTVNSFEFREQQLNQLNIKLDYQEKLYQLTLNYIDILRLTGGILKQQ